MRIYMIGQKGIPTRGGGVERHVEELATRLARRGHEVFVYCRSHYTSRKFSAYRGVHLIHLPTIPSKHLDAIVHTFLASIHILFQRVDIIHYHSIGPALLLWMPRLFKRNVKIFFTFHSQCYHHEKWGTFARLGLHIGEWIGCRIAHAVITVSKILTAYVLVAYQRETTYIPNGATEFSNRPSSSRVLKKFGLEKDGYILVVARLMRLKGIHELICAYQNIATDKKLVIVGEGSASETYIQELRRLALGNPNIRFLGKQVGSILGSLYRDAYLFVHPSHAEGLSIALLEAMVEGCGILASRIPGNCEAIEGAGYTFHPGSIPDLRQKLSMLLLHPEMVRRSGERARLRAERHYRWDVIVRKTEQLYTQTSLTASEEIKTLLPKYEQV